VIQEHIKKPLADEVLFGKLKGGGHVRVVLVKDEAAADATQEKIGFEYVEGPVTPKPEKLPGTRKRTTPRKPKSGGPQRRPQGAGLTRSAGQGVITACANNRAGVSARPPAFFVGRYPGKACTRATGAL